MDLLAVLLSIIGFQLAFVAVFLFQSKKGKRISNRLLGLIFLLLTISIVDVLASVYLATTPKLMLLADCFLLAYGPLILYFTQSVLYKGFAFKQLNLGHMVPFALIIIYVAWFIGSITPAEETEIIKQLDINTFSWQQRLIEFGMLAHITAYLIISKLEVKKAHKSQLNLQSLIHEDNYKWLNFILNSFILFFSVAVIHFILPIAGLMSGLPYSLLLLIAFIFYFVNKVLLKMLNQTTNQSGIISLEELEDGKKYSGSNLSQEERQSIESKLHTLMTEERPYLESDLNINELATRIPCAPKHLSQVINEAHQSNFFDFINRFRIEEAKQQLTYSSEKTILEVLYASGFNSKSSFNTAFKKYTNQTPTEFKNSI